MFTIVLQSADAMVLGRNMRCRFCLHLALTLIYPRPSTPPSLRTPRLGLREARRLLEGTALLPGGSLEVLL